MNKKPRQPRDITGLDEGNGWKLKLTGPVTADIYCKDWNAFIDFIHHENALKQKNSYIFRGHASERWKLEPTLKRALKTTDNIEKAEVSNLDSFKKFCLGRRGHNPPHLEETEWWALGQHFGLNTPLLDWTESPFVAAFFAFNSELHETKNVVVWLLSKYVNKKSCIKNLNKESHLEYLTPFLDENSRLINQRGLFVKSPRMICITEWVKQIEEEGTIVLGRILIPAQEKEFALDSLDKMNINALTLFPDILGSAKHANYIAKREQDNNGE